MRTTATSVDEFDDAFDDEFTDKKIRARVVFNDKVATESFIILASEADSISFLFTAINERVPVIEIDDSGIIGGRSYSFQGKLISTPILLLQETTTFGKHGMRHTRWCTTHWNNNMNYAWWYQRNLKNGAEDELKVEIRLHIRDDDDDEDEYVEGMESLETELKDAGKGKTKLEDRQFIRIKPVDVQKPLKEWHPSFQGEMTPAIAVNLVQTTSTNRFFPDREIEDPLPTSGNCTICHRIAEERGVLRESRRARARANFRAAQVGYAQGATQGAEGPGWEREFVLHGQRPQ